MDYLGLIPRLFGPSRYITSVSQLIKQSFLALRPKQWVKNVLLLVAPFAAGITSPTDIFLVFLGFISFSIVSSIGYIINDLNDIEIDRLHPRKSQRPFASGKLKIRSGLYLLFIFAALLVLLLCQLPAYFTMVLVIYFFNTLIYTKVLKTVPVIEMFSVAIGFVLRLISGALILDLPISEWFFIVGGFGALFVVSTKRLAELKQINEHEVRKVLSQYTPDFLNSSSSISVAISVTSYCFWAFAQESGAIWYQISVIPFVISLFRYKWTSERISAEAPEDAILNDRLLVILGIFLIACLSIAIF